MSHKRMGLPDERNPHASRPCGLAARFLRLASGWLRVCGDRGRGGLSSVGRGRLRDPPVAAASPYTHRSRRAERGHLSELFGRLRWPGARSQSRLLARSAGLVDSLGVCRGTGRGRGPGGVGTWMSSSRCCRRVFGVLQTCYEICSNTLKA